VYATTSGVLSC